MTELTPIEAALAPIVERRNAIQMYAAAGLLAPSSRALAEAAMAATRSANDVPTLVNALRAAFGSHGVEAVEAALIEHWWKGGDGSEPIHRQDATVAVEALARIAAAQLGGGE